MERRLAVRTLYLVAQDLVNTLFLLQGTRKAGSWLVASRLTSKRECECKSSERVYEACMESLCPLPLAAVIKGFCVHGGLTLTRVEHARRLCPAPPPSSLVCVLNR